MQLICNANDTILKIIIYDFFKEIEYHKNEWGTISREIIDKDIICQNPFYIINNQEFNLIHSLPLEKYYNINYKTFFKKNELDHFLI